MENIIKVITSNLEKHLEENKISLEEKILLVLDHGMEYVWELIDDRFVQIEEERKKGYLHDMSSFKKEMQNEVKGIKRQSINKKLLKPKRRPEEEHDKPQQMNSFPNPTTTLFPFNGIENKQDRYLSLAIHGDDANLTMVRRYQSTKNI